MDKEGKWKTQPMGEDRHLITREQGIVAGSIERSGEVWKVEILWNGPTGDITFESPSFVGIMGFVAGVEKAFEATQAAWNMEVSAQRCASVT